MIVCSCNVITDRDIELAVLDIMSRPNAPLPTPGIVYRYLEKRMNCCGCSPVAVETIYAKMDDLAAKGLICPCACASAQDKLARFVRQMPKRQANFADAREPAPEHTPGRLEAAE